MESKESFCKFSQVAFGSLTDGRRGKKKKPTKIYHSLRSSWADCRNGRTLLVPLDWYERKLIKPNFTSLSFFGGIVNTNIMREVVRLHEQLKKVTSFTASFPPPTNFWVSVEKKIRRGQGGCWLIQRICTFTVK